MAKEEKNIDDKEKPKDKFMQLQLHARKKVQCDECENMFYQDVMKEIEDRIVCASCYRKLNKPKEIKDSNNQNSKKVSVNNEDVDQIKLQLKDLLSEINTIKNTQNLIHSFDLTKFVNDLLVKYNLEKFSKSIKINGKTRNFFDIRKNIYNEPEITNDPEKLKVSLLINRILRGSKEYSSLVYYIGKTI